MIKEQEILINNTEYRIKQLLFTKRTTLKIKFLKLVGGASDALNSLITGQGSILDSDIDIGGIIGGILEKLDPDETPIFIRETIQSCVVSPMGLEKVEQFETHFGDNYEDYIPLLVEIVKLNFGGMVAELKKKLPATEKPTEPLFIQATA
ncbi:MAG: hypothetical protein HOD85_20690 [Deltaproteobacteria bacterium]|jgi:hypothetical protein|nr:hypothetical protein [Deltaproteobacteria bacterium]MBT4642453.1 hypothetical protein [Deltaproteobacteria bacterium]